MKIHTEPSDRPRLAVAMIVCNEQDVLAASLESVRSIADEIVVLDTGSIDRTVPLARQLGARVEEMPWSNDFSAARNRCLEAVGGAWVLWLDAGETLAAEDAAALREFVNQQADRQHLYMLWVQRPSTHGGSEQMQQPRLMPTDAGLTFVGRLRESVLPSAQERGLTLAAAPGRLVCPACETDHSHLVLKANRDLSLAGLETLASGERSPRLLLAAAEAHQLIGVDPRARELFHEALHTAAAGSVEMLAAYCGLLATMHGDAALRTLRVTTCLEALEVFPLETQLLLAMGSDLLDVDRGELGLRFLDAAVRFGKSTPDFWHPCGVKETAALRLSTALQGQQRHDEACQALAAMLRAEPEALAVREHLVNLYLDLGRTAEALAAADQMPADTPDYQPLQTAVQGACKAIQQDWKGALKLLERTYRRGWQRPFCLRWLCTALLGDGQGDAARPIVEQWREIEPHSSQLAACLQALGQTIVTAAVQERPVKKKTKTAAAPRSRRLRPSAKPKAATAPRSRAKSKQPKARTVSSRRAKS